MSMRLREYQSRRFLASIALACAVAAAAQARAQAPAGAEGCSLQGIGPEAAGGIRIFMSSGNAAVDADMATILDLLAGRFGALPRLYFFDDIRRLMPGSAAAINGFE